MTNFSMLASINGDDHIDRQRTFSGVSTISQFVSIVAAEAGYSDDEVAEITAATDAIAESLWFVAEKSIDGYACASDLAGYTARVQIQRIPDTRPASPGLDKLSGIEESMLDCEDSNTAAELAFARDLLAAQIAAL